MSKIILGDCLEVMRGWQDNQFDLVLTDPPYGKMWTRGKNAIGMLKDQNENDPTAWDKTTPTQEYFDEMIRVSKHQIIFGGNHFTDKLPPSNCWIVWDKLGNFPRGEQIPFADCELAWTSFNKVIKKFTVIQQGFVKDTKDEREHPTQKPSELMRQIIAFYTKEDWTILDPFAGSGSTLRAAKDLSRPCTVIEINPKYIEIIKKRERQEVLL